MGGPSGHGQHNKAHKAGRKAGQSARQKHAEKKGGRVSAMHNAGRVAQSRAERMNAAKLQRDRKRAEVLTAKREQFAPHVVAFLPLSQAISGQAAWQVFLDATQDPAGKASAKSGGGDSMDTAGTQWPLRPTTVSLPPKHKALLTLLPPPQNPADPLVIVDIARTAESLVLLAPAPGEGDIDESGLTALAVLRAMGLPQLVSLVPTAPAGLQAKAAAKKHASAQLSAQVAGDHKVFTADTADCAQLLRHLGEHRGAAPNWRRHRPALLVEAAEFRPDGGAAAAEGAPGTLLLSGYVRERGLTANQLVHLPGAGDFQIAQIDGAPPPEPLGAVHRQPRPNFKGVEAMDASGGGFPVLEAADPQRQESLQRENVPDPLAGEQTWPTQEELDEAARAQMQPAEVRRLPRGTSAYQAAWILDDPDGGGGANLDDEGEELEDVVVRPAVEAGASRPGSEAAPDSLAAMDSDAVFLDTDGTATEADGFMDEDESDAGLNAYEQQKAARRAEQDALDFPDEVEAPAGMRASVRFAKYRGLKSWRTSPWDPREELPPEYARVFAFENFRRAHKRAVAASEALSSPTSADGVPPGTYVRVHVAGIASAAAQSLLARHAAAQQGVVPPLVATGLLQHEAKLTVLNFGIKKAAAYARPLPSKAELLLVTGVRSFMSQPIYSSDDFQADKHKTERFLHEGRPAIATVYAPVTYPPSPVLAFDTQSGTPRLAFTGTLRSNDPDRINLKKIVLTGFPVKVHKNKAVVRWMFNCPEDVAWFRPLDLWTKYGRRGRIKESMGTHGAMKCLFDNSIQQRDSVCMSLFKRVYPKWPADLSFAAPLDF